MESPLSNYSNTVGRAPPATAVAEATTTTRAPSIVMNANAEFLDMTSSSSSTPPLPPPPLSSSFAKNPGMMSKKRLPIPFIAKTRFGNRVQPSQKQQQQQQLDKQGESQDTMTDLPFPGFSHALAAAVNGKTISPLSELRDSYFPSMSSKSIKSVRGGTTTAPTAGSSSSKKRLRNGSNGSISIRTAFTGIDDRPVTPGGILDEYPLYNNNSQAG